MKQRHRCLAMILLIACVSGCCNCRPGQGLLSNINSARIAAPGTNPVQLPQVARAGEPYYNPQNAASQPPGINAQQGWRPAGAQQTLPPATNPTTFTVPTVNPGPIPPNNVTTASNTTSLQQNARPATVAQLAANSGGYPRVAVPLNPNTIPGGMPLSDATRVSAPVGIAPPPGSVPNNSGILSRAWEYVAHPTPQYPAPQYPAPQYPAPQYPAPQYPAPQYPAPQYPAPQYPAPQYPAVPHYPGQYQSPAPNQLSNTTVSTSSTGAQFTRPRLDGYPVNTNSNAVADGWRQRENYNGLPR